MKKLTRDIMNTANELGRRYLLEGVGASATFGLPSVPIVKYEY